jgi:hypothetical protein
VHEKVELLERLTAMWKAGTLTDDEFQRHKDEILSKNGKSEKFALHGNLVSQDASYRPERSWPNLTRRAIPLLLCLVAVVVIGIGVFVKVGPVAGSLTALRSIAPRTETPEQVDLPDMQIMNDIVLKGLGVARQRWQGKYIEFKFWPSSYEKIGDLYSFTGQDTPFTCDLDKSTFEAIQLRPAVVDPFVIVRGNVGQIDLDEPIAIENCEVVAMKSDGWKPDHPAVPN